MTEIKIKLKVKNVEVELSLEEVRELAGILQRLTGEKEYIPSYPTYPIYPTYPPWPTHPFWYVTTGTGDNITISEKG